METLNYEVLAKSGYNGYNLRAESIGMHQFSLGLRVSL